MRFAFLLLAAATIAGCASEQPQPPAQVATAADAGAVKQVCTRERHVGSDIPVTTCGPAISETDRAKQVNDIADQIRLQTPITVPGGH